MKKLNVTPRQNVDAETARWYRDIATIVNEKPDFEENTFTPTVVSSGGGTPTYSVQYGYYERVGSFIHFVCNVQLATLGTLAAGSVTIANLPFNSNSATNNKAAFSVTATNLAATATTALMADNVENTSTIRLFRFTAGGANALTVADLAGTSIFRVSGTYRI